ncbi:MAG TPA: glycosyltransferase [bacterium]|nr:glycosyltransferase [bacterium]
MMLPSATATSSRSPVLRVLEVQGTSGYGGSEIHTAQIAAALQTDPRFAVHVVISPGGPISAEMRALGIAVTELPLRSKFSLATQQQLFGIARDFRPDLIHTHIRNADWHGGIVARRLGCRWVSTIHDRVNMDCLSRRHHGPAAFVYRHLLMHADALLATAHNLAADTAVQLGCAPERIHVVFNGSAAIPKHPDQRAQFGIAAGIPIIGMIARLSPEKGHAWLLRALTQLPRELPWRLLLAGDGSLRQALQQQAHDAGLGERILWLGYRRDIPELLHCLDMLVAPSYREGFGRSVTEALAAGVPVIASQAGGLPEIIEHNRSGLLVPVGDDAALAAALHRLLADPALRARLAAAGHARWREQFTVERFQRETLAALARAVA